MQGRVAGEPALELGEWTDEGRIVATESKGDVAGGDAADQPCDVDGLATRDSEVASAPPPGPPASPRPF